MCQILQRRYRRLPLMVVRIVVVRRDEHGKPELMSRCEQLLQVGRRIVCRQTFGDQRMGLAARCQEVVVNVSQNQGRDARLDRHVGKWMSKHHRAAFLGEVWVQRDVYMHYKNDGIGTLLSSAV